MANNQQVIDQLRSHSAAVLDQIGNRTYTEFRLKDIDFDNGLSLRGVPIRGKAAEKVLSTLRVKKNFADIGHKMSPEDWSQVSYKLKQAEGEVKLYGAMVDTGETQEIVRAYDANESKKRSDDEINYENYFNWMCQNLEETEKEYALKDFHYNNKKDIFTVTLLENDTELDVFNTGLDLWKMGQRFTFTGLSYNYSPFFERLVCSNGNVARQYGFGTNISKQRYNNKKIEESIRKSILERNGDTPIILNEAVQHLQRNNVSIAEFYAYRKFFEARNENGRYDSIISKYFDEKPFYKAYGVNIVEKSNKWKSTANSGINAYDFFNHLTYLASHPEKVMMDKDDRLQLQINASNLLFKKELDMEDIATSANVDYARLETMF
jgi:hypothetical protein